LAGSERIEWHILPDRITSSVKSAKMRSTSFNQDDEVGVKWE
jgi:hypothetical protein